MNKYLCAFSLTVGLLASQFAAGNIFFSGTIDTNNSSAGGPMAQDVPNSKRIDLASGGISYNNNFLNVGSPATSTNGNTLATVGFIPLTGAGAGNNNPSYNTTNTGLVAVYAGLGTQNIVNGELQGNFDPGGNNAFGANRLVIGIFDRSGVSAGGLDKNNPATWVNSTTDLTNGRLATLETTARADMAPFYALGQPGPPTTALPVVIDPTQVNTIGPRLDTPTAGADGDFKLAITDLGSFFADFFVDPGNANLVQVGGPDVFLNLDQQLTLTEGQTPDVDLLNDIFTALLGGVGFFSDDGSFSAGSMFQVPASVLEALASGDLINNNDGGQAFPGAQFTMRQNPEPTTMLVWGVVGIAGAFAVRKLKLQTS